MVNEPRRRRPPGPGRDLDKALETISQLRYNLYNEARRLPAPDPVKTLLEDINVMAGRVEQEIRQVAARPFLTFEEAQRFLNISHQTIYRLMREGLPAHHIGKQLAFFPEELIKWIREHS